MIAIKDYTETDNQFYPTPEYLIRKMAIKIDFTRAKSILAPCVVHTTDKGDIMTTMKIR